MVQWYLKSPALLKVTTNFAPALCRHESKPPESSDVTLCCGVWSWKSHSTVWPMLTLTVVGSNLPMVLGSGTILTVLSPVPLVVPTAGVQLVEPPVLLLVPPQPASTRTVPAATIANFQTLTHSLLVRNALPQVESTGRSGGVAVESRLRAQNQVTTLFGELFELSAGVPHPERGRGQRDHDPRDQQDQIENEPGKNEREPKRKHGRPDGRRRQMNGLVALPMRSVLRLGHQPKLL